MYCLGIWKQIKLLCVRYLKLSIHPVSLLVGFVTYDKSSAFLKTSQMLIWHLEIISTILEAVHISLFDQK